MKHPAQEFYEAFAVKNPERMAACYHPEVQFSDPVFSELKGKDAGDMWRMLCRQSKDLKIDFKILSSSEDYARVLWNAYYHFSKSGKKVHNIIEAEMTLKDGKIIKHRDRFDFWRWSRQAMGWVGMLLGWSPFLRKKVQNQALAALRKFQSG